MKFKSILAAAVISVCAAAASASSIQLSSGVPALDINSVPGQDFKPQLIAAGATHLYSGPMTLTPSGPVKLTFSLVASESGFRNTLQYKGVDIVSEFQNGGLADFTSGARANGDGSPNVFTTNYFGGNLAADLTFKVNTNGGATLFFGGGDDEFGVFANSADIGALTTFYLGLDDDGANSDDNHDDILIRVDVTAVPLPAAAWMLLAGVGGLFGIRRFRRTA